eukprot:scaffold311938_cov21-Prasinocladus_malaysianus.AAC.1
MDEYEWLNKQTAKERMSSLIKECMDAWMDKIFFILMQIQQVIEASAVRSGHHKLQDCSPGS